jgi:hypothetical protein
VANKHKQTFSVLGDQIDVPLLPEILENLKERTSNVLENFHHEELEGSYKKGEYYFNPLNAELNPICHLLVLLGDSTFMGPCIVSIFQYVSNKMQRYTVHLYLETALHVSGGTSTHHQE